ncbi:MAG: S8 family serine peptidase, partial [Gomphosphaeria aponina SAG 52.96 = DSM 107014]|nr:S8 family serine peptidase [Gomphosphaeria aponina SAG 52.96 = DSM 107014]
DGTNTTFFGSDVEGDGFPNFFGTSAAAPHAAAVAALMLEAKPNATPEEIYAALEKTALDMNDPFTAGSDPGFDNGTGYGLIQADAAIAELLGNAPINGTPGNDVINGTAKNDVINGLGGNDQINGLGGNDQLNGDAGKDRLNGDAGNDQLNGGTGNDILDGGTGNDKMAGGTGNDIYIVAQNKDVVTEAANAGTDEVRSSVTNTLGNNVEKLVLTGAGNINGTGNTLNNSLTGNNGNNTLDGKTGNDTMIGGAGNDVYVVDRVLDVVTEAANAGTDEVRSSVTNTLGNNVEKLVLTGAGNINGTGNTLNNSLTGNNGNNKLNGAGGNDILTGGNGNDQLTGGAGNDQLTGGAGNDQLTGGTGNDQLTGGAGEDWFIFNSTLEKLDTIKDFKSSQKDQIRIDASGFKGGLKANRTLATSQFVIGTGAGDRNDRFIYNDNNGALFFDIDGNKPGGVAQVQIATLTGAPTLAASNIFLF